ncbi:DNA translocase SpoIIIE [bioreactor metagenome]|uniref:DNA translocase SpoIIIE n=1 Tax=bioreactor metagenome TaxID=1076179 RepID=A0A645EFG9_9ZZZZ
MFAEKGVKDITGYNLLVPGDEEVTPLPRIVIIIDELADLMMVAPGEVEDSIMRLAQMARAAGMHLVIATQRPTVNVITGNIKANIPTRIAFAVSSQIDSRTILDASGADKLIGRGDMLYYPVGAPKPLRLQGCLVTDKEVETIVESIKSQGHPEGYDNEVMTKIEEESQRNEKGKKGTADTADEAEDEMFMPAVEIAVETGNVSASMLQRRLKLGYARAARLVDEMQDRGIVGPPDGSKPRQALISRSEWQEMVMRKSSS